ncbi:MAG: hypothetical protein WA622_28705 [Mycobacterium sp.]|uniref:hypothetical protein n=2 Tax=Mycobacterium sp. TaxID=1785 RepID=UPI003BB634E3
MAQMSSAASSSAFVIMPFALQYRAGYDDVIAPAMRAAGLTAIRAEEDELGHIHAMMFERIFESAVVIADVSGTNPNVFYELGVSHGAAGKTVMVVREDYRDAIPFDIAPYRVLVYPKRPDDSGDQAERAAYEREAALAATALASSLAAIREDGARSIANPVQDFLAKRSPLTCSESRYVDTLTETDEEQMIVGANSDIVAVGITSAHFAKVLYRVIADGLRTKPLRIRILTLDPGDRDGWRYVYHLREGRAVSDDEFDELYAEDQMIIRRTSRFLHKLNEREDFVGEILSYRGIPVFWAYVLDSQRIFVGNFAMKRFSARLPVSVLVKDDLRTRTLYQYHADSIDDLTAAATRPAEPQTN